MCTRVDSGIPGSFAAPTKPNMDECAVHAVQTDPTRFLSGSDDGTVRLWSIADESAVACIDSKANVCSVQFSPTDSNLMAFGSANYRVYLYDLRQVRSPLCMDPFACMGMVI